MIGNHARYTQKPLYLLLELSLFSLCHHCIRLSIERKVATQKESSVLITHVKDIGISLSKKPFGVHEIWKKHPSWTNGADQSSYMHAVIE